MSNREYVVRHMGMAALPGYSFDNAVCIDFSNTSVPAFNHVNISFGVQVNCLGIAQPGLNSRAAVSRVTGFAGAGQSRYVTVYINFSYDMVFSVCNIYVTLFVFFYI